MVWRRASIRSSTGLPVFAAAPCEGDLQAVGIKGARQQVVDGDALCGQPAARNAGHKAGQAAARAIGQPQDVDRRLHRAAGDVDDAAKAALRHAVDRGLDQLDGGDHVGVQRLEPGIAVPAAEIAGWRAARIGHDDVECCHPGRRAPTALPRGLRAW